MNRPTYNSDTLARRQHIFSGLLDAVEENDFASHTVRQESGLYMDLVAMVVPFGTEEDK